MVTATLLNRGLGMDEAVAIAREVRDSLMGESEITTQQLRAKVQQCIVNRLGAEFAALLPSQSVHDADGIPMVHTTHGVFPFSKGVILRHLDTSGLELEDAMALVAELERRIRAENKATSLSEAQLHAQVERVLRERHGDGYQRRYKLTHWIRESATSVIILIGGATGTGKSTLAMELAYRLGVDWVTSTDMIRETMRAVVSPALLPGLHDHSFRGMLVGGQVLSNPRERVLAGFRQQAAQVAVGIKAVIERAIRERQHIIIEGTHLTPPFAQYLPVEVPAHSAGFILAVPGEEEHRARFPERSKTQPERLASTYLDAFQSVRWIHGDLLRMAEDAETVVLPNIDRARTQSMAVDILSRGLPVEAENRSSLAPRIDSKPSAPPTLMIIVDGMGDVPNPALGGKTPLEAARTPTLRRLASAGGLGQISTGSRGGHAPNTDEGIMALLGAEDQQGGLARGLFEALGQGIPLPPGAVLFRGNLATVEPDGRIVDRRAGRIRDGVADLLAGLRRVQLSGGISAGIFAGHEHRVLVMLMGAGLSAAVSDTDPGSEAAVQRVLPVRPRDDTPEAARTAEALSELLKVCSEHLRQHPFNEDRVNRGLLPATGIITRGAAETPQRRPRRGWAGAMVARCNTALGVARYLGMKTATSQRMTGSLDTDMDAKFEAASRLIDEVDCVVVHFKGADIAAHDRRPMEKRDFISSIDAALARFLQSRPDLSGKLRVVLSADHGTSSVSGDHIPDPVPLLLATWNKDGSNESEFSENSAAGGALGLVAPGELVELLGLQRAQGFA